MRVRIDETDVMTAVKLGVVTSDIVDADNGRVSTLVRFSCRVFFHTDRAYKQS